jgi:hypothetical protein
MAHAVASPSRRGLLVLGWAVAILLAVALRAVPIVAARPYINYVDEGNYLHPAVWIFQRGGWDPGWYLYPQLPIDAVTAAWRLYAPVYRALNGSALVDRLPPRVEVYDDIEPFDLLLIARGLSLTIGVAVVVLTGWLARRMAGAIAGVAAALLSAVTPALVLRGSIASIDSYAVLAVLACLFLTDLTRTAARPGWMAALAGFAAGLAFASKYPAVVVVSAVVTTTVLHAVPSREKARRIALAAAGLVLGIAIGMPAAIRHAPAVLRGIRKQELEYRQMSSPPLWRQAIGRAEWDLRYERPELGIAFLVLAAAGLFAGVRDRRVAPTVWGWLVFAVLAAALYATRRYQPFRNVVPLVPPACVAIGILVTRVNERLRRPSLVGAVFGAWLLFAFAVPLTAYARDRARLRDTRVEAVDWLAAHTRPADGVLVVRELGLRSSEMARLSARTSVRPWAEVEAEAERERPRFVVAGVLSPPGAARMDALASPRLRDLYDQRFRLGSRPFCGGAIWGENDLIIDVLERKPGPSP